MQLFFAVVGETTVDSVEVNSGDSIASVKDTICTKLQYDFASHKLMLYHTKRGAARGVVVWLSPDAADLKALQQAPVRDDMRRAYLMDDSLLHPTDSIEDHFTDAPARVIHILVVLPPPSCKRSLEEGSSKTLPRLVSDSILSFLEQDRVKWVPTLQACPQLGLPPCGSWLRIPRHYLADSGVYAPGTDGHAILYIRQGVIDEWSAIQQNSVEMPSKLWIVGTPGVGKSCAAFAFACGAVDRSKWDVLWIHYDSSLREIDCIKFVNNKKWTCKLRAKDPSKALESLIGRWAWPSPRPLIVFYDNYIKSSPECEEYVSRLGWWQRQDRRNRRVVCVTSMATRDDHRYSGPRIKCENGKEILPNTLFKLFSWTLDEYVAAVADREFFLAVHDKLKPKTEGGSSKANAESATVAPATPEELVEQKFYVAGGSSLAMFRCSVSTAVKIVREAIAWGAHNIDVVARGAVAAATSPWALYLLAAYSDDFGSWHLFTIVSHLAVRMLAVQIGPQKICDLTWRTKYKNPAMDSFAFEAFVLASVDERKLEYEYQDGTAGAMTIHRVRFLESIARLFEDQAHLSHLTQWYVPTQWYPGGFDALVRETVTEDNDHKTMRLVFLRMMPPTQTPRGLDATIFHELIHKAQLAFSSEALLRVDLRFIVPLQVLSEFTAPISAREFTRVVVDPLSLNVESSVDVVGVQYPHFHGIQHVRDLRIDDVFK